jgi:hypothetical protein
VSAAGLATFVIAGDEGVIFAEGLELFAGFFCGSITDNIPLVISKQCKASA